jgi:hypothetical protein
MWFNCGKPDQSNHGPETVLNDVSLLAERSSLSLPTGSSKKLTGKRKCMISRWS